MTTRRWIVVVVIVGLLMGGVRLKQRRSRLLSRAQFHAQRAAFYPKLESRARKICAEFPGRIAELKRLQRYRWAGESHLDALEVSLDQSLKDLARLPNRIAFHAAMAHEYQRAARYPWLPVEPDPPEPERFP